MFETSLIDFLVPTDLSSLVLEPGAATVLTAARVEEDDQAPPLWLVGEVDLVTSQELADLVRLALADGSAGAVVLDLSRVTFMDLCGLRMLLDLRTELAADGRELLLRAPSAPVQLMLRFAASRSHLRVVDATGARSPGDGDESVESVAPQPSVP